MATAAVEKVSTAAVLAIVLAIAGFVFTMRGSPGWGVLAHIATALLGSIGVVMAASPRVSGSLLSIAAMVLAVFGLGIDVLALLGKLIL